MNLGEYLKMAEQERITYLEKEDKNITEQDVSLVERTLANTLNNEEFIKDSAESIEKCTDKELVNKNPLTEMPNPEMRLFDINGDYFETKEELEGYCQCKGLSMDNPCVLDYLRSFAGRSDVIRKTYKNGRNIFFAAIDEDGYGIYNYERSIYKREFIWEFSYGDIREIYTPFRDRGIVFEDDIYGKIDEKNKQLLKMCREKNLFNMGKE